MENLFDIPAKKQSDNRCMECKYIANLNPHSKCNRTPYGVKAVKRMSKSCDKFEKK